MSTETLSRSDAYAGLVHGGLVGSFLRVPHVPAERARLAAAGARAAVYGIPFDSTSIGRSGANYGPRQIREVSCQFNPFDARLDVDVVERLSLVDCGDCDVVPGNAGKSFERAQADLGEILAAGALPVMLGGDHAVTIPAARAVRAVHEDPGLVLVDVHLDTAEEVLGEPLNHCCPVARAVDAGFDPAKIAIVGISAWSNPRVEIEYCRDRGITVIWLEDVWEHGARWAADRAREVAGAARDGIYLTFDIDALDAAHAPATCSPTTTGLTSREAVEIVRGVAAGGLIGFDVVEVAPGLEPTATTALMAGRLAIEALAFHARAAEEGR